MGIDSGLILWYIDIRYTVTVLNACLLYLRLRYTVNGVYFINVIKMLAAIFIHTNMDCTVEHSAAKLKIYAVIFIIPVSAAGFFASASPVK